MAKLLERERARKMRKDGTSIGAIALSLHVSKSTVSYWCRDIPLSEEAISALSGARRTEGTKALLRASEAKRTARILATHNAHEAGTADMKNLSQRDLFMIGIGLYWGEGYKNGNEELGFTNSDPEMIKFFIKWLRATYGIEPQNLILRVSINTLHTYRINDVERHWSDLTGIPLSQFTKSSLIKSQSKKVYADAHLHFGTLRIKVRRGAHLRRRILGSIRALSTK